MTALLIYSHYFWPSVGGVETYVRLLTEQFAEDEEFVVDPIFWTEK